MLLEFRKNDRGYLLRLERDLFGAYILSRRWYGRRNQRGGTMREVFFSENDACRTLETIAKRRLAHGYTPVTPPTFAPDY